MSLLGRIGKKQKWFPPASFYTEEKCLRCGVCCGSTDGHPCKHLRQADDGTWFCNIYETRLGLHRTVDGILFECVPIQRLIEQNGGYEGCAYVQEIRRLREERGEDASDLGTRKRPD